MLATTPNALEHARPLEHLHAPAVPNNALPRLSVLMLLAQLSQLVTPKSAQAENALSAQSQEPPPPAKLLVELPTLATGAMQLMVCATKEHAQLTPLALLPRHATRPLQQQHV